MSPEGSKRSLKIQIFLGGEGVGMPPNPPSTARRWGAPRLRRVIENVKWAEFVV